jgi:hypothetical protein
MLAPDQLMAFVASTDLDRSLGFYGNTLSLAQMA